MIANLPSKRHGTRMLKWTLGTLVRSTMALTHNGIALIGLAMAALIIVLLARTDLRETVEQRVLSALLQRQEARNDALTYAPEPTAIERVTAAQPANLPKDQAQVAFWLSRKYRVAPEPLSVLVAEAFHIGERIQLDPTLILAVMAIESRFNPFAQSHYGAQGLMQVMTRVHTDKYEDFGGTLAAFDPISNLRVGVQVLRDCIARAGSVEGGLRLYVGAVTVDGGDYVERVMGEHLRLRDVALGKRPTAQAPRLVTPTAVPSLTPVTQPAAVGAESAQNGTQGELRS